MDLELENKVALVTGGSRGIGKAIALVLAEEGADVALAARSAGPLEQTADEIGHATGRKVIPIVTDVRDDASVRRMVEQTVDSLGRLDILVCNAGVPGGVAFGPIDQVDDAAVQADLETKFLGTLRCSRAAAPHLRKQGAGRIIGVGGLSARYASAYRSQRNPDAAFNYAGGPRNLAMIHLARTLSHELGSDGITANVVLPGATRTEDVTEQLGYRARHEGRSLAEVEAEIASGLAIGRIVDAREIGYVVAFLASPRAGCISGEVVAASGGSGQGVFT